MTLIFGAEQVAPFKKGYYVPKKAKTPPDSKPRKYDNSNRQAQAEATRDAILDALTQQMLGNNTPDFSIEQAALDAGVTTRTIFRHFPSRDSMLSALSERVLAVTGKVAIPQTPDQFVDTIRDTYSMFDDNRELMQSLLLSELGRGVRSQLRERRRKGNTAALAPLVANLPGDQQKAIAAVLVHLISAESWWQLQDRFHVSAQDSAHIISWIYGLVANALKAGKVPPVVGE